MQKSNKGPQCWSTRLKKNNFNLNIVGMRKHLLTQFAYRTLDLFEVLNGFYIMIHIGII